MFEKGESFEMEDVADESDLHATPLDQSLNNSSLFAPGNVLFR